MFFQKCLFRNVRSVLWEDNYSSNSFSDKVYQNNIKRDTAQKWDSMFELTITRNKITSRNRTRVSYSKEKHSSENFLKLCPFCWRNIFLEQWNNFLNCSLQKIDYNFSIPELQITFEPCGNKFWSRQFDTQTGTSVINPIKHFKIELLAMKFVALVSLSLRWQN